MKWLDKLLGFLEALAMMALLIALHVATLGVATFVVVKVAMWAMK